MIEKKILMVEDDLELAHMYRIKFEKEGFTVKIADNGLSAISVATEFKPNMILLDIMMPSMDGYETLRVIRELAPSLQCKIVMFSNLNSKENIEKCMKLGADAYLLKAVTTPKDAVLKAYELLDLHKEQNDTGYLETQKTCPHCGQTIHININILP